MVKKIKEFLFENRTASQTVAKNTVWLFISNFGGRLLKAVVIIYAARVLGAADYGIFSYAVTLAGFVTLFMDPGVNGVLIRDIARASQKEKEVLFSNLFFLKAILLAIGVSVVIFIAPSFSTLPGAKALLPIVAFILTFDTLREFFVSLLRGIERMEWEAGIFILTNLGIVIFGFIFIMNTPTAASLGWGYAIGTALGSFAAIFVVRRQISIQTSSISRKTIAPILSAAWPFAITGALGMLLTNTDILIISWMQSASAVGIYSAVIRVIQVLYLLPGILQLSTIPLFARLANKDDQKLRDGLERTLGLVFLISIPISIGGVIVGTSLMNFIFGSAFSGGGLSFKILMVSMLVDYPGTIIAATIFTYGHQKSLIVSSAIGGISNVIFDLLFIPHFGIAGSAVATLIAQILSNSYLWYVMKKINYFEVMPRLGKIAASAAFMAAACLILSLLGVNVVLNIALCVLLYFGLLKSFREPLVGAIVRIIKPSII